MSSENEKSDGESQVGPKTDVPVSGLRGDGQVRTGDKNLREGMDAHLMFEMEKGLTEGGTGSGTKEKEAERCVVCGDLIVPSNGCEGGWEHATANPSRSLHVPMAARDLPAVAPVRSPVVEVFDVILNPARKSELATALVWRGSATDFIFDLLHRLRTDMVHLMVPVPTVGLWGSGDALECAWGIIANAGGGDWDKEGVEWKAAAIAWRDRYYSPAPQRKAPRPERDERVRAICATCGVPIERYNSDAMWLHVNDVRMGPLHEARPKTVVVETGYVGAPVPMPAPRPRDTLEVACVKCGKRRKEHAVLGDLCPVVVHGKIEQFSFVSHQVFEAPDLTNDDDCDAMGSPTGKHFFGVYVGGVPMDSILGVPETCVHCGLQRNGRMPTRANVVISSGPPASLRTLGETIDIQPPTGTKCVVCGVDAAHAQTYFVRSRPLGETPAGWQCVTHGRKTVTLEKSEIVAGLEAVDREIAELGRCGFVPESPEYQPCSRLAGHKPPCSHEKKPCECYKMAGFRNCPRHRHLCGPGEADPEQSAREYVQSAAALAPGTDLSVVLPGSEILPGDLLSNGAAVPLEMVGTLVKTWGYPVFRGVPLGESPGEVGPAGEPNGELSASVPAVWSPTPDGTICPACESPIVSESCQCAVRGPVRGQIVARPLESCDIIEAGDLTENASGIIDTVPSCWVGAQVRKEQVYRPVRNGEISPELKSTPPSWFANALLAAQCQDLLNSGNRIAKCEVCNGLLYEKGGVFVHRSDPHPPHVGRPVQILMDNLSVNVAAGVVIQNTAAAVSSLRPTSDSPGPCPPAHESMRVIAGMKSERPPMRFLHDAQILIKAIWPDAPATATLDDIAAVAKAHREIFEQYGKKIAQLPEF